MPKVILYIATSLDGYIARPDGNLDWLTSIAPPDNGDYGYSELLQRIGTTIMGRTTYEEVLGFGIDWPYSEYDSYVLTSDQNYFPKTERTFVLNKDLTNLIDRLKKESEKDIWLIGGGQVVTKFLDLDLIDEMIITVVPKIIGDGIRLFPNSTVESTWNLIKTESFNTGLVSLTYEK